MHHLISYISYYDDIMHHLISHVGYYDDIMYHYFDIICREHDSICHPDRIPMTRYLFHVSEDWLEMCFGNPTIAVSGSTPGQTSAVSSIGPGIDWVDSSPVQHQTSQDQQPPQRFASSTIYHDFWHNLSRSPFIQINLIMIQMMIILIVMIMIMN